MPNSAQDLLAGVPCEAILFFAVFSRFEFALKHTNYFCTDRWGGANPNWKKFTREKFAEDAGRSFLQEVRASPSRPACPAHDLLCTPAAKEIVVGDKVDWQKQEDTERISDVAALFAAVRRVRHNLFHGGKDGTHGTERDKALLTQSVGILELALEKCQPTMPASLLELSSGNIVS